MLHCSRDLQEIKKVRQERKKLNSCARCEQCHSHLRDTWASHLWRSQCSWQSGLSDWEGRKEHLFISLWKQGNVQWKQVVSTVFSLMWWCKNTWNWVICSKCDWDYISSNFRTCQKRYKSLAFNKWHPVATRGHNVFVNEWLQHTSFPALVTPLTVCSSTRLPLMFRYFTFLQDTQ